MRLLSQLISGFVFIAYEKGIKNYEYEFLLQTVILLMTNVIITDRLVAFQMVNLSLFKTLPL